MIGIIHYEMGNITSVKNACDFLNLPAKIITNPNELDTVTHIILPGVGSFSDGIKNLNRNGFFEVLKNKVAAGVPLLGICLGMQLLASQGEEGGKTSGFGFIPGTANALLFSAFLLLFTVSLPIRPDIKKDVLDSKIGSVLVDNAQVLERPFNSIFGPIAKQTLTFLTINPQETGSVPLEFTQKQLTVDYSSEQKMFEFVNQERIKRGIKPLVWDERLTEVGRSHSKDMFGRGYFSHYSPEGKDVGDRLQDAGIAYTYAGENLALAPDVTRANNGLINSEGHRRNILDPAFEKIGVGAIDGGVYGKMFTQVFTN